MGGVVKEAFLDANVILRYLLNDIPEQADAVDELLKEAEEGKILLRTTALVIAEIVWTCESYYELPKEERTKFLRSSARRDWRWKMPSSSPKRRSST